MKIFSICFLAVSLILPTQVFSAMTTSDVSSLKTASGDDTEMLKNALEKRRPGIKVDTVLATPIAGLFQVVVGTQVVYMDIDAHYMLDGDMVNLLTAKNYSEDAKSKIRLAILDDLGEKNMLVYSPKKVEYQITVITDIDCPYCRRLHNEMDEYMASNVEVRYIFMPLKGVSDRRKTESVWCAEDKKTTLDMAKAGDDIETLTCDNPLAEQMEAARKLGVRGTPAIVLESGEMLPGYIPAKKLVAELRKR